MRVFFTMTREKLPRGSVLIKVIIISCLLCLAYVLVPVTTIDTRSPWHVFHPESAVQKSQGAAAGPVVSTENNTSVVAGLMVTRHVPSEVIKAVHSAVQDFNAAQKEVQVFLRMYVGQEGHPMLEQQLALEESLDDSRDVLTSFPVFVKGQFPENMDDGKTYEWFRFASTAYPSSDWILKFDTDVAVNWTAVSPWLRNTNSEVRYLGLRNSHAVCGRLDHCPPPGCADMSGNCWTYMSGGFYGLSTSLARIISDCQYYQSHKVGYEDLMVGKAVKQCTASNLDVQIMAVPLMAAWCHSKAINLTHIRNGMHKANGCVR